MNVTRTSDSITVRRLDSEAELAAAIEPEAMHATGLQLDRTHSVWATSDNSAVAVVFTSDDEHRDEGWMVVARGPVRKSRWAAQAGSAGEFADEDGPGEPSIQLVDAVRAEVGGLVAGLTAPRSAILGPALERWRATAGADWDLMVCDTPPPPQRGESLVLTGLAEPEVQAFLDRVNPHHSVRATDPTVESWAGIRGDDGVLHAVGALTRRPSGVGYLASIATDPAARGTGYGSAITAHLTRRVFDLGEACCTLAHYHPNDNARRVYLRIGYRTIAQNYSAVFDEG